MAAPLENRGAKMAAVQVDFSKGRKASGKDDIELNAAALALLASMEESVRPKELAAVFPRIVNRMASIWRAPQQMNGYFEDLLTDTRGSRQGFPLGILMELTTLKDYYQTKVCPPTAHDVWDPLERAKRKS
jgi:hypothetical protein